jgi:hypothetical protein
MKHLVFACCLLLVSCVKSQPNPSSITPDSDTVRKLRDLAQEASLAEQPKAAQLTTILLKARIQLWAISNASNDEKAMIYAAEASKVLGLCNGERDDECDAAYVAQLEKDLKIIERGKEAQSVQEIKPLLEALKLLSQKKPEGQAALRVLCDEDSWRGTAARLFALSYLVETWTKAAKGSTIQALATLQTMSGLVCAGPLLDCASKTKLSPWAQEGAEAFAFGNGVVGLLQKTASDTSDFGKTAQTYSLKALEASFQSVIPLPPPAKQSQVKVPTVERWTNAGLAFPQSVKSGELPRLCISIQDHAFRLGMPPALQIVDKNLVLLEEVYGLSFPGKELNKSTLAASIQSEIQTLQNKSTLFKEQLDNLQAMVVIAEENSSAEEIALLANALSSIKINAMYLLVSPKQAPTKEELVFGAALPFSFNGTAEDTLLIRDNGTYQATLGGVNRDFSSREELLSQASAFSKAPQFMVSPKATIGQVVTFYDELRAATKNAWGTLEQSPLLLIVR